MVPSSPASCTASIATCIAVSVQWSLAIEAWRVNGRPRRQSHAAAEARQRQSARLVNSCLRDAERLTRDPDAAGVKRSHGDSKALALVAQSVFRRHLDVLAHQLPGGRAGAP